MSLWQETIETVEAHAAHRDLGEAILQAAFLFEKARINPGSDALQDLSASFGWPPEVAVAPVDVAARDALVEKLKILATLRPGDSAVGSIYWALGKVGDPALRDFFIAALREQLNRNPGAVFQVMVALDNLGERIFGERRSRSIDDVVENRKAAEQYLAQARE
jgi:hypothetical protein